MSNAPENIDNTAERNIQETSTGTAQAQDTQENATPAAAADTSEMRADTAETRADTTGATVDTAETSVNEFAALGLGPEVLRAISELGYSTPTPIQEQTISTLLAGRDVIAQAPTGTGKTAAYGLPIVERLDEDALKPQALVLAPTRELAIQVSEALHTMGKYREMVTLPIYGGAPYDRQLRALARGVQVVVGTPGRILDHIHRKTLDLSAIRTVVLDEADEMLSMGFIEDIETILAELPGEHQSALFSATIPVRIARLAEQYLRNPALVRVAQREAIAPRVRQVYYDVPGPAKLEVLSRILDLEEPESAIVFVRTRLEADNVSEQLNAQGYLAQAIHGEINQSQRERVLDRFRKGHTQLLVATDVAARGLDIPDVSHIINYDLPVDAESYVHRIGRTGRAGRGGEALTLVTPRERRQLRLIEDAIHRRLERLRLPTPADVAARRRAAFREEVLEILDDGQLDPFLALVEDLVGTHEPAALAAAAFKMAAQARDAARPGRQETWVQQLTTTGTEPAPETQRAAEEFEGAGARGRRPARRDRQPQVEQGMARLFLRVGRRDGVRPADLVGAIANEAGVSSEIIGDIDLYDTFSFVEVAEDQADAVLRALNRSTIRGRPVRASIARPGDEWATRGDDREAGAYTGPRDGGRERRDRERRPSRDAESSYSARRSGPRDRDDQRRPLRVPASTWRTAGTGRKGQQRSSRSSARHER
ncbi:MAG: DEAD/DEAH box helicase [Ktedonobacterales bacterium]